MEKTYVSIKQQLTDLNHSLLTIGDLASSSSDLKSMWNEVHVEHKGICFMLGKERSYISS